MACVRDDLSLLLATNAPHMALAADTKTLSAYSPTSTPVLDVMRIAPHSRPWKLTAGEYFFVSSVLIAALTATPALGQALAASGGAGSIYRFLVFFLLAPLCALAGAWLVHETGHLLAGLVAGFRFRTPDSQHFQAGNAFWLGIAYPRTRDGLRRRLLILYAGGPLCGLAVATALEFSRDWSQSAAMTRYYVHLLAAITALFSLATLLPDTKRNGNFSDGARLLMLIRNDELAARWFAIAELEAARMSGLHPRAWDPAVVACAAALDDDSRDSVAAHWLAWVWANATGDITSASKYLEETLSATDACPPGLRDQLYLEAAIFQAWFRDNPAKARSWAALIRPGSLDRLEMQRLQVALLWAEGKLFDAFEKLSAYLEHLSKAPPSPSRELAEKNAADWKHQMESRMLTRAWRAMYSLSQQVESSAHDDTRLPTGAQVSSC